MSAVTIQFTGNEPYCAHEGDAGFDITAAEHAVVPKGERRMISTGLRTQIPKGYEIQVRSRSGSAHKHGIAVLNSPATIDSGYTGEIKVILINTGGTDFVISEGDRIAQLVVNKLPEVLWKRVDEIPDDTSRSGRGIGSSGISKKDQR